MFTEYVDQKGGGGTLELLELILTPHVLMQVCFLNLMMENCILDLLEGGLNTSPHLTTSSNNYHYMQVPQQQDNLTYESPFFPHRHLKIVPSSHHPRPNRNRTSK